MRVDKQKEKNEEEEEEENLIMNKRIDHRTKQDSHDLKPNNNNKKQHLFLSFLSNI